jgi:hypothetical protein
MASGLCTACVLKSPLVPRLAASVKLSTYHVLN